MSKIPPDALHSTGDYLLNKLMSLKGSIGIFVKTYPGVATGEFDGTWLDNWFTSRTQHFLNDLSLDEKHVLEDEKALEEIGPSKDPLVTTNIELIAIQPHYFRGFRSLDHPIMFNGELVVIEGKNSTGKTSLTEAFEWLFTGELIRRKIQSQGTARELENCISHQLRPIDEETWVEAVFRYEDGSKITLRRLLISDYGDTTTSKPTSTLFLDGNELSEEEEIDLINSFFGGVAPLLMQHSLRLFVLSSPVERRDYFERLLQLDEVTNLIEKAVVTNDGLSNFPSPSGSITLMKWEHLKTQCKEKESLKSMRRVERDLTESIEENISNTLISIATNEFQDVFPPKSNLDNIVSSVEKVQALQRQKTLPILAKIKPTRTIDQELKDKFSLSPLKEKMESMEESYKIYKKANEAAASVSKGQIAIAAAFEDLRKAGVILDIKEDQVCPLCDYKEIPSLSPQRITEIKSWTPIQQASSKAKSDWFSAIELIKTDIEDFIEVRKHLVPNLPDNEEWEKSHKDLSSLIKSETKTFRTNHKKINTALIPFDNACQELYELLSNIIISSTFIEDVKTKIAEVIPKIESVIKSAKEYSSIFNNLDNVVGRVTSEDPSYSLRDAWLDASSNQSRLKSDIRWEQAKKKAQSELKCIREILMNVRQDFLNHRRVDFSQEMSAIWDKLRSDLYSKFTKLYIPEPRGRGFPVEIEVKAYLDGHDQKCEVDALRVFSESQINVLGIAAFITRSKLLGHRTIILDDPVQSMDDDHFNTFATKLLPYLLQQGFRVIILTHNFRFAREVSYAYADDNSYVTMRSRLSRRKGCQIDEGNRRVSERLKRAEKDMEEGKFESAWLKIRLAIERLYTIAYNKYGPFDFNPLQWSDQTAEYMWDSGVNQIFQNKIPGSPKRLKAILRLTLPGAHIKTPTGETDLVNAITDIKEYLKVLQLPD